MCGWLIQSLLANHAPGGATPLKWPTETARGVAVGHADGVAEAESLESKHTKKEAFALGDPTFNQNGFI